MVDLVPSPGFFVSSVPKVTLGGVPLSLRTGQTHQWVMRSGVQPHQQLFDVTRSRAERIFRRGRAQFPPGDRTRTRNQPVGPISFVIDPPNRPRMEAKGLYVIGTQPGADINHMGLLVADRRWLWQREIVDKVFNVRRMTGEFRLLNNELQPIEVAQRSADFTYRRTSMDAGVPYTARRVLEEVLKEVVGPGGFVFDDEPPFQDPVESLVLQDNGQQAVGRALGFLAGMDIYQGLDGLIHVYNTLSSREERAVQEAGAPYWFAGNREKVDRSLLRPAQVSVYIPREAELRFDYLDGEDMTRPVTGLSQATIIPQGSGGGTMTSTDTVDRSEEPGDARQNIEAGREPLRMENVLPCPDPTLDVIFNEPDGGKVRRTVAYGTWITFEQAIEAWRNIGAKPALGGYPEAAGPLTFQRIRRWYLAGMSFLHHLFTLDAPGAPDLIWSRRLAAVQEHWRRTFRVLPQWMDKIRSVKAQRAAIIDQENGTRARSDAYFDHTVKPSFRGIVTKGGNSLGWQVLGWAPDLGEAQVSPADVRILDSDNGIVQITPRVDLYGMGAVIAPGLLDGPVPEANAAETITLWNQVALRPSFRLAVVVSAVQDTPNDERRLEKRVVTPAQVQDVLGFPVDRANGPEWHIHASDETARYAWLDAEEDGIRNAFFDGDPFPSGLLVNPDTVNALAKAQAARIYAVLQDRVEGAFSVGLRPRIHPTGSLRQVAHGITYNGRDAVTTTTCTLPPITVPPSVWSVMPEKARKILRRLVEL